MLCLILRAIPIKVLACVLPLHVSNKISIMDIAEAIVSFCNASIRLHAEMLYLYCKCVLYSAKICPTEKIILILRARAT